MDASDRGEARAALLTPWAPGGIAVIAVTGNEVEELIRARFRGRQGLPGAGRLAYGHWVTADGVIDEVLLRRCDAVAKGPSPTGFEIHGHGGIGPARAILASLEAVGVRIVSVDELSRARDEEAFVDAARLLLDRPASERAVRMLLDQVDGALGREVARIEALLSERQDLAAIADRLRELAGRAQLGIALCRPTRLALIGRPNVGKSSLLNRLLGRERAIVSDRPGTTRDPVSAELLIEGVPFGLVDTAGIRRAPDPVEAQGIDASWQAGESADCWLVVLDRSEPPQPEDREILRRCAGRSHVIVWNKSDRVASHAWAETDAPGVTVSCRTGDGIAHLRRELVDRLGLPVVAPGEAVPFTRHQRAELENAANEARRDPERTARRLRALRVAAD